MIFGNLQGLVNGTEQIVFDYEVTGSAVSSISTGNILNGNEDGWYTIIVRMVAATSIAAPAIRLNNDSGANYGRRGIEASVTTVYDTGTTGATGINSDSGTAVGATCFQILKLYAKSGSVRLCNRLETTGISGTTVDTMNADGFVWNNTTDNISNITFATTAGQYGVGSRFIILKSNNFTNGTPTGIITTPYIKGAWVRVGSQILSSPASSVTFSGLDGDRDVLYYVSVQYKDAAGGATTRVGFRPNNVSTTSYGYQELSASDTTVGAARNTSTSMYLGYTDTAGYYAPGNMLLFAKSGYVRPGIICYQGDTSNTAINNIRIMGWSFNDTSNNITSLVCTNFGGANFNTGSQFDLYALRPNG